MNKGTLIAVIIGIIVALGAAGALMSHGSKLSTYDNLTSCLKDNGAVMFGASWCPHCADQKKLFEKGAKNIPYFECSPNGASQPQAQECTERLIMSYPVWQFDEEYLTSLPDEVWSSFGEAYDVYVTSEEFPEDAEVLPEGSTNFDKLKAITGANGFPYYNQGRLPGVRTLDELALYGNCEEALAQDRNQG